MAAGQVTRTRLSEVRLVVASVLSWGGFAMWFAEIVQGRDDASWTGAGVALAGALVSGLDSFHEARSGRWIEPEDYAWDERRGALGRTLFDAVIGAAMGAGLAFLWALAIGERWSVVAPVVITGAVVARVVATIIRHAFRQTCATIHATRQPPVETEWIEVPAPVRGHVRRAIATGAIGCGLLVSAATAPEFGPAGVSIPKGRRPLPRHATTAFVLCAGSAALAFRAAKKHGGPRIERR